MMRFPRCLDVLVVVLGLLGSATVGASASTSASAVCQCPGIVGTNITHAHMDAVENVGRVTVMYNVTQTKGPYRPDHYFMVRSDTWYKNDNNNNVIGLGQLIVKTTTAHKCQGSVSTTLVRGQKYILLGSIQDELVPDYAGRLPVFSVDGCRPQKATSTVARGEWLTLIRYSPAPSASPTTAPFRTPTASPTAAPTPAPSTAPSAAPVTSPSTSPTASPSPSTPPTVSPTAAPTLAPTDAPTAAPVAPEPFHIFMDATVKIPAADKRLFQVAANRWQSVIRSGHAEVDSATLGAPPAGCQYPATIDDLYLCATYDHFGSDGPGKFIGFALPVYWRLPSYIPVAGFMSLDSADVPMLRSKGLFTRTILHELGHVLGIGTQWERTKLTGTLANGCPYFGPKANEEYKALTGCAVVATELDGGVGTHCQHWDELCLGDELMTGYLGGRTQLSRLTIAGLEDLGYEVNYANSDYLGADDINPQCMCKTRRELLDELPPLSQQQQQSQQQQPRQLRHGDVTLLHHTPSEHRRKLSDAGHLVALTTGREILEKLHQQFGGGAAASNSTDLEFVADRVVSVLMKEGDEIYGVLVEAGDPMP